MELKDFLNILKKYRRGDATTRQREWIDKWYDAIGKASQGGLDDKKRAGLERLYWSEIEKRLGLTQDVSKGRWRALHWYATGIAASLILGLLMFPYFRSAPPLTDHGLVHNGPFPGGKLEYMVNEGGGMRHLLLPDSSSVTLSAHGRLTLGPSFNESRREVYLEGEAFFDVSHDEARPFLVYTNGLTTRVLGTSFRVKAFPSDREVLVEVRRGKVSVQARRTDDKDQGTIREVMLTPNQQAVYDKTADKLSKGIVAEPQAILSEKEIGRTRFHEAPVREIFDAVEKMYGIDIVFDEALFSSCILTTTLSKGDLYNRLQIICKAINADYIVNEHQQIEIRGPGCN